jgi:amino acid transporter
MKDPQRDIPFSLLRVLGFKAILYLLIQVVCIGTLVGLAQSKKPLADAAETFMPGWGGWIITAGGLISFIATLNGGMLVASRIGYGMAQQHVLPSFLSRVHPEYRTPHISLLLTAGILLALTLTNSLLFLLSISAFGRLFIYVVTCAAMVRLRKKQGLTPASFVLPAGKLVALLAILCCLAIMYGSTWQQQLTLAGVLGAGGVLYVLVAGRKELDPSGYKPW